MKIAGYRDLNTAETELVARIQTLGKEIDTLIAEMRGGPAPVQINPADGMPLPAKEMVVTDAPAKLEMAVSLDSMVLQDQPAQIDVRWLGTAQKQLADGILSLTRAVTQPTTF